MLLSNSNNIMKLNKLNYNYRVQRFVHNDETGRYENVFDRLYSQLKDVQKDFPDLTIANLKYLIGRDTTRRLNPKYRGLTIKYINPIPID
jgi:hypothetical protein